MHTYASQPQTANRLDETQGKPTAGKATVNKPTKYADAKVAMFMPFDMSKADGSTTRARTVLSCLDKDLRITPVAMRSPSSSDSEPFLTVKVPKRLSRQLLQTPFWLFGVVRILIEHKFDALYVCDDWFGSVVYLIMHQVFKQKVIFEAHGILSEESRAHGKSRFLTSLLHCWEIIVLRHCDVTIALSGNISEFCKRYSRKLVSVPVFVDANIYRRNEGTRATLRRKYGWQDSRVVGLIGPFNIKWNEDALEFLENNMEQFDNRIVFAIMGKFEQGKNLNRCFNADFVRLQQDPGFLSCLDAILVARKRPTSGPLTKIIESMSFSLPVFTTPQGMVGMEYAKHGRDIIVTQQDVLARTLNSLIFDEDLMRTIGLNARQTVEKHYSYEANAARLVRAVESSIS